AEASQPEEPEVRVCPLKNFFSRGVALVTSSSVSADWAPESAEATETSVAKPELERAGSVMPYVSFPASTACSTWDQVTSAGFQPSDRTVAVFTPIATGLDMIDVSETTFFAASGRSRR